MTKVKIEFFKSSGKWYETLEFETTLPAHESHEIARGASFLEGFIKDMNYTLEVSDSTGSWNKYLILVDIEK